MKWQPWDSRQDEGKHQTLDGGGMSSRGDPSVTAAEWLSRYSLCPFYFNRQTTVSMPPADEKVSYNVAKPAWVRVPRPPESGPSLPASQLLAKTEGWYWAGWRVMILLRSVLGWGWDRAADHVYNNNNNVHLSCAHQRPERSHDTY